MKTINGKIKNELQYKLFDINDFIELIKKNKELSKSLENSISLSRNEKDFKIINIINEDIKYYPNEVIYFIIYKKNTIISTSRLIIDKKTKIGYINMVFVNPDYRGKKICQINLEKLISLTKLKIYDLHVLVDNIPAIKCYENIGFKFYEKDKTEMNMRLMRLNL